MTLLGGDAADDPSRAARALIRSRGHAALATSLDGRPYASLVATSCDMAGNILMLLSDLAQHSANIRNDPRVSLLFDEGAESADPLAAPRLSLLGRAKIADDAGLRARFVARHPIAARYAGFGDFHLYRMTAERGHLVAGFGRIDWVEGGALRVPGDCTALAEAEPGIVEHMNNDHGDAVALYAGRLARRPGEGWRLTGVDPEGIDLRREQDTARLAFATPVHDAAAARGALIALVDEARATARV